MLVLFGSDLEICVRFCLHGFMRSFASGWSLYMGILFRNLTLSSTEILFWRPVWYEVTKLHSRTVERAFDQNFRELTLSWYGHLLSELMQNVIEVSKSAACPRLTSWVRWTKAGWWSCKIFRFRFSSTLVALFRVPLHILLLSIAPARDRLLATPSSRTFPLSRNVVWDINIQEDSWYMRGSLIFALTLLGMERLSASLKGRVDIVLHSTTKASLSPWTSRRRFQAPWDLRENEALISYPWRSALESSAPTAPDSLILPVVMSWKAHSQKIWTITNHSNFTHSSRCKSWISYLLERYILRIHQGGGAETILNDLHTSPRSCDRWLNDHYIPQVPVQGASPDLRVAIIRSSAPNYPTMKSWRFRVSRWRINPTRKVIPFSIAINSDQASVALPEAYATVLKDRVSLEIV